MASDIHFDFSALLVLLAAITGGIWLGYVLFFKAKFAAIGNKKEPVAVEYARSFFPVILVVLVLRSFIIEPFRIPSDSMVPTLRDGDFILVNKFSYGLRLPVIHSKFVPLGLPERGDVAVFRYPENPKQDYIKRIVGLPGDVVGYHNKRIYVNGKAVGMQPLGVFEERGLYEGYELWSEQLGEHDHQLLRAPNINRGGGEWRVPEGNYFAIGDNRDNSKDSRYWGFVPERNLVGKAFFIWMNWERGNGPNWSRIGNSID